MDIALSLATLYLHVCFGIKGVLIVELLLGLTFRRLVRHDRCPLLSHRNYTLQEYKLFTMMYTLLDTMTHCHCWLL
jgi:hypothetical protein